jgi:hypothetical protein
MGQALQAFVRIGAAALEMHPERMLTERFKGGSGGGCVFRSTTLHHVSERGTLNENGTGTGSRPVQDLRRPLPLVGVELQPIVHSPVGMCMGEERVEQDTQGGGQEYAHCYHGR